MPLNSSVRQRFLRSTLGRYSIAVGATVVALLLRHLLDPLLGDYSPYVTVFLAIIFLAMYVGVGPSVVAVVLGGLGVEYWFVEPRGSFRVHHVPNMVASALSFLVASGCVIAIGEVTRKSQRERAQKTAAEIVSQRLRRFLEAAPTGLVQCSRDFRYVSANSAYAQIAGLPLDQIIGRRVVDVMGPDAWEIKQSYVARALHGERVEFETLLPLVATGPRQVHVVCSPEREGREVVGWVASVTDVTEFKRLENQLRETEKMAAAGQLAASLAHEINNPLMAVVNVLYLLAGRSDLDPDARGLISNANNEVARLARIVKQSLSYYCAGMAPEEVDLAKLIDESLQVYRDKFRRGGIAVDKRITPGTSVIGFADQIRQVIDNLLVNAAEATSPGGRLTVCLRLSRNWKNRAQLGVRLTIADTGSGIPKAHLSRIFEPFFSTKADKGNGLGLWVAKGIVEKHGGNIKFRSTDAGPRKGTAVSIFWPSAVKPLATSSLTQSQHAA